MSLDNETNTLTLDNKYLTVENKSLKEENIMLLKMLSEKDSLVININIKLLMMEDQMKQLVEQNNNMETQLSRLMSYLVSFAVDVKDKSHYIKYK
jgi:hypothetical protein